MKHLTGNRLGVFITLGILVILLPAAIAVFARLRSPVHDTSGLKRGKLDQITSGLGGSSDERLLQARQELYLSDVSAAAQAWRAGDIPLMKSLLERQIPTADEQDLRQFEWYALRELLKKSLPLRRLELPDYLRGIAFSPASGELAVVLGSDHSVAVIDPVTGSIMNRYEQAGSAWWRKEFISYSPDGSSLAYQPPNARVVRVRNLETNRVQDLACSGGDVYSAEFSPDGRSLASGTAEGVVQIWNLETGSNEVLDRRGAVVSGLAYAPDGKLLAVSCRDRLTFNESATDGTAHRRVKVYDLSSGEVRCEIDHDELVEAVAFSPDGRFLAIGGGDGVLKVYDFNTDSVTTVWRDGIDEAVMDFPSRIRSVVFSPNGNWLVSAGFGIKVWDTSSFRLYATLGGHASAIQEVAFSADNLLASAGLDHTVLIWDLSGEEEVKASVRDFGQRVDTVAVCPNGEIAVRRLHSSTLAMWDPRTDRVRSISEAGEMAVSRTGILASVSSGKLRLTDLATGEVAESPLSTGVTRMAYSSDSDMLAIGTYGGEFELWKASTGELKRQTPTKFTDVQDLTFSPDGNYAAAAHPRSGKVTLWHIGDAKKDRVIDVGFGCGELSIDFSPDGKLLAVGRQFLGIQIWDLGDPKAVPRSLPAATMAVEFAPTGLTLFSGSMSDSDLHVWDLKTGRKKCALPGVSRATNIAVSGDGATVAVCGWDGTVRLLRAPRTSNRESHATTTR